MFKWNEKNHRQPKLTMIFFCRNVVFNVSIVQRFVVIPS